MNSLIHSFTNSLIAGPGLLCHDNAAMARDHRGRPDVDLPKVKLTRENLREAATLLSYLRPYQVLLLATAGALIMSALLELCLPYLAGCLMDAAMPGSFARGPVWLPRSINVIAIVMLGVLTLKSFFAFFHSTSLAKIAQNSLGDLRRDTYRSEEH